MASKLQIYQFRIFAVLFIGYAVYAYNRKGVSFALPKLMEEGLDKSQAGWIISSQNIAYTISKFLGGVLSDRISSRLLFSLGIIVSGIATVLFSTASSVLSFSIWWFVNGFAQGCGWPACAKMLRKWYSPTQFGTYWSVLSASANIAGGLAPFFSVFLIINYGWRMSLVVSGLVSVTLGVFAIILLVNTPEEVGLPGFEKESPKKDIDTKPKEEGTVADVLRFPLLWLISFCYMIVFCGKSSAVDWGQMYLMEDRNRTQYTASAFTSSVESGGFLGGVVAGYVTDWAVRKHASKPADQTRANPRLPVAVYFIIGIMCCLHLLQFHVSETSSQLWISGLGFVLGACFYGPIAVFGVVASECAPSHLSGTAHAIVALAANIGAIIAGLPFTYVAEYYSWSAVFFVLELMTGFVVLVMLCCRNFSSTMLKQKTT